MNWRNSILAALTISLVTLAPFASAKNKASAADYQDATLVSKKTQSTGMSCSSTSQATKNETPNVPVQVVSNSRGNCSDNTAAFYTIKTADGHTFVLTHHFRAFTSPKSSMSGKMPGIGVQYRIDKDKFFVRVGDHETQYNVVSAE